MIKLGLRVEYREPKRRKQITREELELKIQEYFTRGGRITHLEFEPNPEYYSCIFPQPESQLINR